MTRKPRQKFKYLEKEKAFKMKLKAFFINLKGFKVMKNANNFEANKTIFFRG